MNVYVKEINNSIMFYLEINKWTENHKTKLQTFIVLFHCTPEVAII